MTLNDLVNDIRVDILDDNAAPYLWSDAQLIRYANEACLDACLRAPLISRVYSTPITAATPAYTLDASVRQIYTAKLDIATEPLIQTTDAELSLTRGSSWRLTDGTPTHYVRKGHTLTLYPKPLVDDVLVISTSNIPDDDFDLEDDIDPAYHSALQFYIAYKCYLLNDADTKNPAKAAEYLAMFTAIFGIKKSAKYDSVAFDSPLYGSIVGGRMC